MQVFGCLIILLFIGFFIIIAFFSTILMWIRNLFGQQNPHLHQQEHPSNTSEEATQSATKKVFADDEGEYVDYVEVKKDS